MFGQKKIIALIPLRGGSKSIPYKNIRLLAGKPLAYWTLKAADEAKHIHEVWVSTEDAKIKETVQNLGLNVNVIDRPMEFAQDTSSTESVMLHFMEQVPFDVLVTIQATTPFTTAEDLDQAIETFFKHEYDSLLTGTLAKRFYWTLDGKALNYNPHQRPRRQEWPGTITENGAFYITKKEILETIKNRIGGKVGIHKMDHVAEIDEIEDWKEVERIMKRIIARRKKNEIQKTKGSR